ncbi:methyltransferase [Micrococcales bacterium 31B]|nr:methyltransferase [Micrococcales bacterium 31B]
MAWVGGAASADDLAALRHDLAEFTVAAVTACLGEVANEALLREQAVPALLVTEGRTDLASLLVRLFTLGQPVALGDLEPHLPSIGVEGMERLGLIACSAGHARALVDLRPYAAHLPGAAGAGPTQQPDPRASETPSPTLETGLEAEPSEDTEPLTSHEVNWLIISDLSELAIGGPISPNHVLGIGGATATLAQATVRRRVARALDLGTGCGLQALHAAQHADHVVATDISWRALDMAGFNARLNGIDIELRFGSMLEPVRGETFDLVVSNPPFVITPRSADVPEYTYRDGGRSGDSIVEELVREVGEVLKPGGIAQFLGNWERHGGEGWDARIRVWVEDSGLDAWVIQRESQDPAEYAETWIRDGGTSPGDPHYRAMMSAWLDDLDSRDVRGVGFGLVTLTRRDIDSPAARPAAVRVEERPEALRQPLGPHLDACLSSRDWLLDASDDDLLDTCLERADDVTEERHYTPGSADPNVIVVNQGQGFGRKVHADTVLAGFVGACDGELTARQIIGGIAVLFELDAAELTSALLPTLRDLVQDQFLAPADPAQP